MFTWMCHSNNLSDVVLKALIEHSVCLIEDQVADSLQIQAAHVYQVLQPKLISWRLN